jgi:hypothetical protein
VDLEKPGAQEPIRGTGGEGSDRALPDHFRTYATDCEFTKVSWSFALNSAQFHEAPFQGSRRRHLPAAAAKPDGTRAGRAASSLPGGGASGEVDR